MKIKIITGSTLTSIIACAVVSTAHSQIAYTGSALNYAANFNSLGTTGPQSWTDNSTLPGWYLKAASSTFGSGGIPTSLNVVNGGGESTAGAYNVGTNGVDPLTTRALGWVVASTTGTGFIGLELQNTSGSAFSGDVTFNYAIGQFSAKNAASETVSTGYKIFASTGNQLGTSGFTALDSIANPNLSNVGGGIDGFATGNYTTETDTIDLSSTPWANNQFLLLEISIPRETSGNNELLAVESMDVTIVGVPEPSALALCGSGLAGLLAVQRLRRK